MNDFCTRSIAETIEELHSDALQGLSAEMAQARLKQYGENKLLSKQGASVFQMFISQFKSFLVVILIAAAVISIAVREYLDGSIILAIVVLNAILGVTQENKANNALNALKELSSPLAKVWRDGSLQKIPSNLVVPGDIALLEAGDYIPADIRLLEAVNLKIDEAALTGESLPVDKNTAPLSAENAPLGDRFNSAFMGTIVTYGRGKGIVTGTGMYTQMGKIAAMLETDEEESTPLQKKLDHLGGLLGKICIAVCLLIFALGFWRHIPLLEIFMTSVSLAVAAIPEGLTVVVTVVLALGMQQMVKANAIVKHLSAVETLGSTTVICSDKTGTLTQNKMTVVRLFADAQMYQVSGTGYQRQGEITDEQGRKAANPALDHLLTGSVLCNDASYDPDQQSIIGDPTEGALLVAAAKYGIADLHSRSPRLREIPFDSDRKLMSTFHADEDQTIMYTKGSPDEILRRSSYLFRDREIVPLTNRDREAIAQVNETFAASALRVLGLAFKTSGQPETAPETAETALVFVGLAGMIDPPREEAKAAIAVCKQAGIGVKMITGDHRVTATAIANALGIEQLGPSMEGREIGELSDGQLRERVKTSSVFARVSPEHKVRLIEAIKANGNIVAMTGDGVNDAPSLKRADIGVAMGITGTDVSKEAADIVLTDDNFASIVAAVEQGRMIYSNIRKVVSYLLSCNIGEILVIFVAMLIGLPIPLFAIQLLAINLITDAFPAFALGMEAKENGLMREKPRNPSEHIINQRMRIAILFQSAALAVGALGSFSYGLVQYGELLIDGHPAVATTMCFVTLILGELLRAYASRSEKTSIFRMPFFSNAFLNKSALASIVFLCAAVYLQVLNPIFKTIPLSPDQLTVAVAFALLPMLGGELGKRVGAPQP